MALLAFMVMGNSSSADALRASPPARSSLEVYDIDYAWVTELRRVGIAEGDHDIIFEDLPSTMVPSSAAMLSSGRSADIDILEQHYQYSLQSGAHLLQELTGLDVEVTRGSASYSGTVVKAEAGADDITVDVLLMEGEHLRWVRGAHSIKLLSGDHNLHTRPRLIWKVKSRVQQAASLRLTYKASDLGWNASYNLVTEPGGSMASLNGKVGIENRSGQAYNQARITLVRTEQGAAGALFSASDDDASNRLRYSLSHDQLRFEQQVVGPAGISRYMLDKPVTLDTYASKYVQLLDVPELPVELSYVYDGVVFDRFQRNRRNDWNYGTESHPGVDVYLSFDDLRRFGVKEDLPGGRLSVFERGADGGLILVGEEVVDRIPNRSVGRVRIGSAPSLIGQRDRIGYSEISPLHEYEESFEIRLENVGESDANVKVIEHLYRWPEYEVVKSDTEYNKEGPQKISFDVLLKPGGSRSIHYSVRYRW